MKSDERCRPRVEPTAYVGRGVRVRAARAGLDEYQGADPLGACGGGEHGRVAAQRLADQDGTTQSQLVREGDDVGDRGAAVDILRMAFAGAVSALVGRDEPMPGARSPCRLVPFACVTGRPVRQHDGLPRPAPVAAETSYAAVLRHGALGPRHVGPPGGSAELDHAARVSVCSTGRPRSKRAPAWTRGQP